MAPTRRQDPSSARRYRDLPDELWSTIKPILDREDPPRRTGRRRIDRRAALDAIIFHLYTGCPWSRLPDGHPSGSSVQRTFQRWKRLDIMDRIWATLVVESLSF